MTENNYNYKWLQQNGVVCKFSEWRLKEKISLLLTRTWFPVPGFRGISLYFLGGLNTHKSYHELS